MRIRHGAVIDCDWPELMDDLLSSVYEHLDNRNDIRRFGSVCQKWRQLFILERSKAYLDMLLPFEIPSNQFHLFSGLVLVSSSVTLLRPLGPGSATSTVSPWIVRVEEVNQGKIHLKNPLTGDPIISEQSENLPPNIDLIQFHVSELFTGFNLIARKKETETASSITLLSLVQKVLAMPVKQKDKKCSISMVVLYKWGNLAVFSIKDCNHLTWYPHQYVSDGSRFQDVVIFRQKFCAIDENGILYQVNCAKFDQVIVHNSIIYPTSKARTKRRLVVSESGDLYLVVKNAGQQEGILVYMLRFSYCENSPGERRMWEEVRTLDGKVMVLSVNQGFFASAADFPRHDLANCVVFSSSSFGVTGEAVDDDGQEIGVFRLGDANQNLIVYLKMESFAYVWSPPSWLSKPHTSSAERESREDKKVSLLYPGLEFLTSAEENKISGLEALKSDMESNIAALEYIKSATETDQMQERIYGAASKPAMTSLTQISATKAPMTNFIGLNIRSDLVPTLKQIWLKHGNIVAGCTMRNGDIVARALESLATIVLSLENSTGSSFTKEQVNYMRSTLSDLQHMKLNVEWLVPFVEKAMGSYKATELISTLEVIGEVKVRASEAKTMLLAELAKVEKLAKAAVNVELHLSSWLACLPNQLEY